MDDRCSGRYRRLKAVIARVDICDDNDIGAAGTEELYNFEPKSS
jgi:hypothetical protein